MKPSRAWARADRLSRALGVPRRGVVAFVGAGGKTAAIRRVLSERPRALATTTTHLGPSGFATGMLIAAADEPNLLDLERAARRVRPLVLGLGGGHIVRSPSLGWHAAFARRHVDSLILVECDGARRRLVKLPAPHEPAWPPAPVAGVVIVVGAAALGEPFASFAHRPERWGTRPGERIQIAALARMVQSYLELAPPRAPVTVLVTGCGQTELHVVARIGRVARMCVAARDPRLQDPSVALRIVATQDASSGPYWVWAIRSKGRHRSVALAGVCGILLAAGRGERFALDGEASKLLAHWSGRTLVEHAASAWARAGFTALRVVTGHAASQVEPRVRAVLRRAPTEWMLVHNPRPARGLGSSVRLAARAAPPGLGLLFGHADMPAVRPATLRRIAVVGATLRRAIVQPTVGGRPVNPVYFPADLRSALARVVDSRGGRPVIESHRDRVVELALDDAAEELVDVDRLTDLTRLQRRAMGRSRR